MADQLQLVSVLSSCLYFSINICSHLVNFLTCNCTINNGIMSCMGCGMSYRERSGVFTLSGQQLAIVLSQSNWLTATAAGTGTETEMNVG